MSTLATIFIIAFLIFFHELGHLLASWSVGIPVERFSVGFGPVLFKRRKSGVEYCLSLIPLGGYVLPRCASEEEFAQIPALRRIVMWLGGPLANFVLAAALLAMLNVISGGFSLNAVLLKPWLQVAQQSAQFVAALPTIFMHLDQLSGIIGIVAAGNSFVGGGIVATLRFAVLLNLNLAIFNLLPMSPLDGGKILCCLLEKLHPGLARLQTGFAIAGLAVLLVLMAYTTVIDVMRQFA